MLTPQPRIVKSVHRLENLHVLRAVAAISVVLVHLESVLVRIGLPPAGNGGVDIFFVISGFIMVYICTTPSVSPGSFMKNRITRIVPLYWAVTFFVFFAAAATKNVFRNTTAGPLQLLMSLFFIPFQKAAVGAPQPIVFVGWTLNYEMFFYCLFAFGLALPNRRLAIAGVAVAMVILVVLGATFTPSATIPAFYTNPMILEFVCGMLIGLAFPHLQKHAPAILIGPTVAATLVALGMLLHPLNPAGEHVLVYGVPATVLVLSSVLLDIWKVQVRSAAGRMLGDASYSIYLTHAFIAIGFQRLAVQFQVTPFGAVALLVVAIAAILAVGIVTHRKVELPLIRWSRSLWKLPLAANA